MQNIKLIISVILSTSVGLGGGFWYGYKQGSSIGAKKIVGEMIDEGKIVTRQGSATSTSLGQQSKASLSEAYLILGRVDLFIGDSLSLEVLDKNGGIKKVTISDKTDITKVDLSTVSSVRTKDQGAKPAEIMEVKADISELKNGTIIVVSTVDDFATKTEIIALKIQLQNNFPKDKLPQ